MPRRHRLPARRAAAVLVLFLLVAGCSSAAPKTSAATPPGCGMAPAAKVVGLLGRDVEATGRGSVRTLRTEHRRASCRNVVPGHPERFITISAEHHPKPMRLPTRACSAGWVYAGTPEKYTPACQDTIDGHGRTQLIVRWQPYVLRVTIGRSDRDWAGDPEQALALSRLVAQRLGVREAAGDG